MEVINVAELGAVGGEGNDTEMEKNQNTVKTTDETNYLSRDRNIANGNTDGQT